jgi:transposase
MSHLKPKANQQQESTPAGSVQQLIRQVRQATRKRYAAEEKIRIVMEGIRGDEPVTTICRREGIHANLYYKWLKEFMEAGKARLKAEETRGATRGEVEGLKRENDRLKQLVAELSVENMVLKKSLL